MPSRPVAIVLALVAAGAVLYFYPRGPKNPEDQVRAMVAECVAAANDKDVASIMDHAVDEFVGPQASRKQDVKQILAMQLLRNQEVATILNPTLSVELKSPDAASIVGYFVFARTKVANAADLNPQTGVAAVYKIDADVERRDGKWMFTSAQYQRVNGW